MSFARRGGPRERESQEEAPTGAVPVPETASSYGDLRELASFVGNQAFATIARSPDAPGRLLRQDTATADPKPSRPSSSASG